MLALIGSFLLKLLGSGIITPILAAIQNGQNAARDEAVAKIGADQTVDVAALQAQIQANLVAAQIAGKFPWIVWMTWFPFAAHLWAVAFVTIFGVHTVIPAFPPTFEGWEGIVLLAPFVHHPITLAAKAFAARAPR
jgi:hypothetical protein